MKSRNILTGFGTPVLALLLTAAIGCEQPGGERTTWGPAQTDERARWDAQDRDQQLQQEQRRDDPQQQEMGRMGEDPRAQDREIQRRVREAITQEDNLSTAARNVQVEVENGIVTLRGMIENEEERNELEQIARRHAPQEVSTHELRIQDNGDAAG